MILTPLPEHQVEFDSIVRWINDVLPTIPMTTEKLNEVTQKYQRIHVLCGFPESMFDRPPDEDPLDMIERLEKGCDAYFERVGLQ